MTPNLHIWTASVRTLGNKKKKNRIWNSMKIWQFYISLNTYLHVV
jgi:hypothetical protein